MRPIAEATARVTGKSCSRKYIALGRIVNAWTEIVGQELATKAQPVGMRYPRQQQGKDPAVILEIAASSGDATLLHYQKGLIMERINQLFGAGWVTDIKFVAEVSNTAKPRRRKLKKPLTEKEKTYLSGILGAVEDEDMKTRLGKLGESILTEA